MDFYEHGGNGFLYGDVIDFSANINPLGMPREVLAAARKGVGDGTEYPDCHCTLLREGLGREMGMETEWIFCGNGAAELFFHICLALKPRKALLPVPSFQEYAMALGSVNCEIKYSFLREERGFVLQKDFLEELGPDLDMVFLCNPNNPTGLLLEKDFLLEISRKCAQNHIVLVLDECFLDFCGEQEAYSLLSHVENSPHLIIVRAFTKLYAMPGLRLGYGVCSNLSFLRSIKEVHQPWNVSTPAQYAGIAALQAREYKKHSLLRTQEEKAFLLGEMKKYHLPERVYGSSANYIFYKGRASLGQDLLQKGFFLRDCSNYPGLEQGFYRIAVRGHEENKQLIEAWKEVNGKWRE